MALLPPRHSQGDARPLATTCEQLLTDSACCSDPPSPLLRSAVHRPHTQRLKTLQLFPTASSIRVSKQPFWHHCEIIVIKINVKTAFKFYKLKNIKRLFHDVNQVNLQLFIVLHFKKSIFKKSIFIVIRTCIDPRFTRPVFHLHVQFPIINGTVMRFG